MAQQLKIIVGVDASPQARDAITFAGLLALRADAKLLLAHVVDYVQPSVAGWNDYEQGAHAEASRVFEACVDRLAGEFDYETFVVPAKSGAHGLMELASDQGADLVVVGSSAHGAVGRVLVGSTGERLLHGSPCPVVVVPRDYSLEGSHMQAIALGYDGGDEARAAVAPAVAFARAAGCDLKLIAAVDPSAFTDSFGLDPAYDPLELQREMFARLTGELQQAAAGIEEPPHVEVAVETGDPVDVLTAAGQDGADLLLVGSRGYGPMEMVLLGSVAAKLTRTAPCPVMVVPRSAD